MIAKTFQGLEEVLAKELQELGAEEVETITRGVRFFGDQEMMYKANFKCRTALRILKPFYKFEATDTEKVYEIVKAFDWSQYLNPRKTFAIDAVVYSETFKHSKFLAYKVKDAIADHFREKYGERPSVRITNPDIQLNIHVNQEVCTLSLDSSGEPLYMRGYKVEQTEAPINEVLAAGMLKLAGWDGQCDFMDPMCGSGTIAIEAALMALNIAPGVYRKGFAFEKWPDFDKEMFDALYEDDSDEREFNHKIYASDISSAALRICTENVKSAGMSKYIEISHTPFQSVERPENETMVMFNPPYGERIKVASLSALYEEIGAKLKRDFTDMSAWIITVPCEATDCISLRPSVKYQLMNGQIECEFRKYEMFKGRRDDYVRERKENSAENENNDKKEDRDAKDATPVYGERDAVFTRHIDDKWQREAATEDELSEYRMRRHEAFAQKQKEQEERKSRFSRSDDRRRGDWNSDRRDNRYSDRERGDRSQRSSDGDRREGFRSDRRGFEQRSHREGRGDDRRSDNNRDGYRSTDRRDSFRSSDRYNRRDDDRSYRKKRYDDEE